MSSSKFIQGQGRPALLLYNNSDELQTTLTMPYVRDDSNSFIKQYFDPYPKQEYTQHDLLSGGVVEDAVVGYKFRCQIKYQSILSSVLILIYHAVLYAKRGDGYIKLKPREDCGDSYRVVYKGNISLESVNSWRHNAVLEFAGTDLLNPDTFAFEIP